MSTKKYSSHTDFEKLMQGYELYNRIINEKIPVGYLSEFPKDEFLAVLKNKSVSGSNIRIKPS